MQYRRCDGDVTLTQDLELQHDGATISFGVCDDINITHVADTGLTTNGDFTVGDDLTISGGVVDVKNTGSQSVVRFYCESSNALYRNTRHRILWLFWKCDSNILITVGTLATTVCIRWNLSCNRIRLGYK